MMHREHRQRCAAGLVGVIAMVLGVEFAHAQEAAPDESAEERRAIEDTIWRKRIREREGGYRYDWIEPDHLLFELRFGPYWPEVDEDEAFASLAESERPFAKFFGGDPRFYFGVEFDWLPIHLPYVGSFGAGFGWGYTRASGNTYKEDDGGTITSEQASSTTALNIFPMHISAVVRLDGPLRKLRFPVVPYVKAGFGMGMWAATGPDGTSTAVDGTEGAGTSVGLHLAVGAAVALNTFDPGAANGLRENTGIRYTYLWGEWMHASLRDTLDDQQAMYVGTSTAIFGFALDW